MLISANRLVFWKMFRPLFYMKSSFKHKRVRNPNIFHRKKIVHLKKFNLFNTKLTLTTYFIYFFKKCLTSLHYIQYCTVYTARFVEDLLVNFSLNFVVCFLLTYLLYTYIVIYNVFVICILLWYYVFVIYKVIKQLHTDFMIKQQFE